MKQIIRDYLSFNKRERNGVLVLLSIVTLQLIYLNVSDKFQKKEQVGFSAFEKQMDSVQLIVQASKDSMKFASATFHSDYSKPVEPNAGKKETLKAERFDFDPNALPEKDWKRLGFSEKQIKSIKNFESKGGKFRKKEDLKKMYCIKEDVYFSLEPYIRIAAESKPAAIFVASKVITVAAPQALVEINTADSAQLTNLKGIGPFFAKMIIKYRDQLGGFYAKEQLMEVWKFDKEKYDAIEKSITVDPARIRKINLNACEADQLKGAYLKWNAANAIVNYRKQHGKFKTIDDIRKTDLVDEETLRKIAPYLEL